MNVSPSGSQIREQEERVMIGVALSLGLLLIPLLFAWFFPGSIGTVLPASWWEGADEVGASPERAAPSEPPPLIAESRVIEGSTPELAAQAVAERLTILEKENAGLQARLTDQEQRLASSVPAADLAAMEKEMNTLKDLIVQLNATSKRQDSRAAQATADLAKARANLKTAQADLERMNASEAKLRQQSEQEAAAARSARTDLAKLQAQFDQLKALRATDLSQLDANGRKAIEDLKLRLATAEKDREAAVAELERMILREKAAQGGQPMPPPAASTPAAQGSELQSVQAQLKAAQERIRQLEEKLSNQPGARSEVRTDVFRKTSDWGALPAEATQPGDLWIGAMPLFQTLKQSTSAKETVEVRDAYVQSNHLGTLVARIYFEDAQSRPSAQAAAELQRSLADVNQGSYLLAVGYASVEGKTGYNDALSSRRAQSVVDLVRPSVKDGKVQMVFFGETSQFDSSDLTKNRVVELWLIDP